MKHLFKTAGSALASLAVLFTLTQLQGCVGGIIVAGGAGAAMAVDRRSAGTIVDDQAIELKISKAINEDEALGERAHINITSYNNIVLLTGETPTDAMRDHAIDVARHTEKVRKVYNEIVVTEPTTVKSRSEDSWITAKAKTKLLSVKEVSAANVKVVTENRAVYLMGIVSHAEGDSATETARFIEGVARVVPLFEYLD